MTNKKSSARRISVWVLIFALIVTTIAASFALTAHAKGGVMDSVGRGAREAVDDVKNAVSDVVDSTKETTSGAVNDTDGMIGNEKNEAGAEAPDDNRSIGWIGLVIAIAIVLIAIVLIVILIPKKKKKV